MAKNINKRDALIGEIHQRKATASSTQTKEDRLTFVIISENNEGKRFDWRVSDDYYIERLDINGANTSELRTFFKDHNRSVDSAIGRVENVRKDGTSLLCDVVFDKSGEDIKRKYQNGTISDVSIGYRINTYEVEQRQGEPDVVTVTDFSIVELSAVGIGFDSGAKYTGRDKQDKKGDIDMDELKKRLKELEKVDQRSKDQEVEIKRLKEQIESKREDEIEKLRAEKEEATRRAEVMAIAARYNVSDELRSKFEDSGTPKEFMQAILDERANKQEQFVSISKEDKQRDDMLRAMADAIAMNAGVNIKNPHKDASMFRGASLVDIARKVTGVNTFDKNEIASRAMVTADFPMLLVQSGNRVLEQGYKTQNATYQKWVREVDMPDFKTNTDITLGTSGRLSKLNEAGEIKEKQLTEAGEDWKIESFANEFVLTRQMIVNDDLGSFNNLLAEFGQMAKRTANGIVYDLLQAKGDYADYKMKDGLAIFASGHNNLASSGAAISEATLTAARTAMMRQKSQGGKDALNIIPRYLIVAPEQEITARQIIASASTLEVSKNAGVINPFAGSMQVIVDAELESGAWYLAGDTRTIKAGYLAGTGRKPIVQLDTSSLTRTIFQGVFDFGVVAEDFRSLYKNPGA